MILKVWRWSHLASWWEIYSQEKYEYYQKAENVSLKAGYRYIFFFNGKASAGNSYIVNTMFGVFVTICKKLIEVSDAATRAIQLASKNAFSVLFNISVIYKH